jgi:hypothetical protein
MHSNSFSKFIKELFREYNNSNISYLIIRNYENYPDKIGGDIDISIKKNQQKKALKIFRKVSEKFNFCIIKVLKYPHMIGIKILDPNLIGKGRSFLAFDFFYGFTYRGLEYLDFNMVWEQRKIYKNFYVVNELSSQIITLIHYLLYNNNIPSKYRPLIKIYLNKNIDLNSKYNFPVRYIIQKLKEINFNWDLLLEHRKEFLKLLLIYNFNKNIMNIFIILFEFPICYFKKIFNLTKIILIINSSENNAHEKKINLLIDWINNEHIFSKYTTILKNFNLSILITILNITIREGFVILLHNKNIKYIKQLFSLLGYTVIFDSNSSMSVEKLKNEILKKIYLSNCVD